MFFISDPLLSISPKGERSLFERSFRSPIIRATNEWCASFAATSIPSDPMKSVVSSLYLPTSLSGPGAMAFYLDRYFIHNDLGLSPADTGVTALQDTIEAHEKCVELGVKTKVNRLTIDELKAAHEGNLAELDLDGELFGGEDGFGGGPDPFAAGSSSRPDTLPFHPVEEKQGVDSDLDSDDFWASPKAKNKPAKMGVFNF